MAESITFNNAVYIIPDVGESNWGQNLTNYFVAIPQGAYQASGGTLPLTADLSFGTNFGLFTKYVTSITASPAGAGIIRLANTDSIDWRNAANSANLALSVDTSNNLLWNGDIVATASASPVLSIAGTANEITASAATGNVTLSVPATFIAPGSIAATSTLSGTAGTLTATTNQLVLGTTHTTTLTATAPSASRVYTIPDAGGSANVVLDTGNYTIGGTWSFSNSITLASSKALILTDNTSNTVTIKATNSTTPWTMSLPTTHGSSNQFLQTDGAGNTTWAPGGAGTISSGTIGQLAIYTGSTTVGSTAAQGLLFYRRPNLVYTSGTVVTIETGLDGTSGDGVILFPDGSVRTETVAANLNMTISQTAIFTNATQGSNRGGIDTGTVANNKWYAVYAVKVTTFSTDFVLVASLNLPLQANYATLNTNFGANGWVYLGLIRNGDGGSTGAGILKFVQSGNETYLYNPPSGQNTGDAGFGMILATTAGATSLSWAYSAGTSGAVVPNNISFITLCFSMGATTGSVNAKDSGAGNYFWFATGTSALWTTRVKIPATQGILVTPAGSTTIDIMLISWTDLSLGIGANPLI
jgi:hypothetical protein